MSRQTTLATALTDSSSNHLRKVIDTARETPSSTQMTGRYWEQSYPQIEVHGANLLR